ncbi:YunG family protein [Brevibacillus sp. SAFN-007a]|uniref:YunG family protein n=1 Tax=Brevibacillus sp. SAFN-007a TaxID=3436862 RepID=UPI003F7EE3C3
MEHSSLVLNPEDLQRVLVQAWSLQSSSKWTPDNPARGQCGVTALVVNDILGGEILKTQLPDGVHFYNRISGRRYDFTESQFKEPLVYADVLSSREEAFRDTNAEQYTYLKHAVLHVLGSGF